jgi:MscS family membrane protein
LTRTSGGRGATSTTARRAKPKDDDWGKGKKEGKSQSQGKDQKKKDKDKDKDEEKPKDETSAAAPVATEDAGNAAEIVVPPGGGEHEQESTPEKTNELRLSRGVVIVSAVWIAFTVAIAACVNPKLLAPVNGAVSFSARLARKLADGTIDSEFILPAMFCIVALLALRFFMQPIAKRLFFWWTDSTSEKAWNASALHWVFDNVYGPLEVSLVAVAALRFLEAGVKGAGWVHAALFGSVVEKLVACALVVAFSRVVMSWQERFFSQKAFELELEGKELQADRLVGVSKLSKLATSLVVVALGLKVLGVDIGALVTFGGISGLAIGLAGRQILENAFMGLMLYATSPFMPGDEIKFSTNQERDIQGFIIDIGLFRTSIRSLHREMYYIPNSLFSTLSVLNITRRGKEFRIKHEVKVRLADTSRVASALTNFRALLKSDPRVMRSLHRRVFISEITPEGLTIMMSFFVEAVNKDQFYATQQDFLQKFLETCKKNNVRLAAPTRAFTQVVDEEGPLVFSTQKEKDMELAGTVDINTTTDEADEVAPSSKSANEAKPPAGGLTAALADMFLGEKVIKEEGVVEEEENLRRKTEKRLEEKRALKEAEKLLKAKAKEKERAEKEKESARKA